MVDNTSEIPAGPLGRVSGDVSGGLRQFNRVVVQCVRGGRTYLFFYGNEKIGNCASCRGATSVGGVIRKQ